MRQSYYGGVDWQNEKLEAQLLVQEGYGDQALVLLRNEAKRKEAGAESKGYPFPPIVPHGLGHVKDREVLEAGGIERWGTPTTASIRTDPSGVDR